MKTLKALFDFTDKDGPKEKDEVFEAGNLHADYLIKIKNVELVGELPTPDLQIEEEEDHK